MAAGRNSERLTMTEEIVRCPYCVLDDHFRQMLCRPEGWFVCQKCGHTAMPEKPEFKCLLSEVRGVESSRLGPKAETRKRVCESEEQWLRGYLLTS